MIYHPPVLALLSISIISVIAMMWAATFAIKAVRRWNLDSSSALQISLEKRSYLVGVIVKFIAVVQILSTVFFVHNADRMAPLFIGAMCAVGSLEVNAFGLPLLWAKLATCLLAAVWLLMNRADQAFPTYPLTKRKYRLLLVLAFIAICADILQLLYFYHIDIDVITSCCSVFFSPQATGLGGSMATMAPLTALIVLFGGNALMLLQPVLFKMTGRWWFGTYTITSIVFLGVALAAIVSAIAPYIYGQPHHHCPFCFLKVEYHYVGYGLYALLFAGTITAISAAAISWRKNQPQLTQKAISTLNYSFFFYATFLISCILIASYSKLLLI